MAKITFGLSTKEINQAIKQVEGFRDKVNTSTERYVGRLVEEGKERARQLVVDMGAVDYETLHDSIAGTQTGNIGMVYADADHAAYVEFGTGIRGQGFQHPEAGLQGWEYDVNEHGDAGWWYPTDKPHLIRYIAPDGRTLGWTRGWEARPYMYQTKLYLEAIAPNVAREVFGDD